MKRVVIVSQDFFPNVGGIARYLENFITKYLSSCEVYVITDKKYASTDYSMKNYHVKFFDFDLFSSFQKRQNTNIQLVEQIVALSPDALIFGYIRTHTEITQEIKIRLSLLKTFLICHAKEIIFNKVKKTSFEGKQKGYISEEIPLYQKILGEFDYLIAVSEFTRSLVLPYNENVIVFHPPITPPVKRVMNQVKKRFFV